MFKVFLLVFYNLVLMFSLTYYTFYIIAKSNIYIWAVFNFYYDNYLFTLYIIREKKTAVVPPPHPLDITGIKL